MNEREKIREEQYIIFLSVTFWGSLIMAALEKSEGDYVFAVIFFLFAIFCGIRVIIGVSKNDDPDRD